MEEREGCTAGTDRMPYRFLWGGLLVGGLLAFVGVFLLAPALGASAGMQARMGDSWPLSAEVVAYAIGTLAMSVGGGALIGATSAKMIPKFGPTGFVSEGSKR